MLSGDPNQAPRNIELSRARSTQAACIVSIGSTPPRRMRAARTAVIDPAEAPPIASTRSGGSVWFAQLACTAVKSAASAPASYAPSEIAPDMVKASLSFPMMTSLEFQLLARSDACAASRHLPCPGSRAEDRQLSLWWNLPGRY